MKQLKLIVAATSLVIFSGCDTLNQAAQQVITQGTGGIGGVNPSATEIALGLKQALENGTSYSSERLAAQNGFLSNAATQYFKRVTTAQLSDKFRPVIQNSLGKVF